MKYSTSIGSFCLRETFSGATISRILGIYMIINTPNTHAYPNTIIIYKIIIINVIAETKDILCILNFYPRNIKIYYI